MTEHQRIEQAASLAVAEAKRASERWPEYHSLHEGFAVIFEELDELKDAMRANDRQQAAHEAIQVASTAIRFAATFCTPDLLAASTTGEENE